MRTFIGRAAATAITATLLAFTGAAVAHAEGDVNTGQGGTGNVNTSTVFNVHNSSAFNGNTVGYPVPVFPVLVL